MRAKRTDYGTSLWLSAADTWAWANRPGACWPCSTIAGRRLFAEFDGRGDLVDVAVDGKRGEDDGVDGNEFSAITSDHLRAKFGADHPAIRS